MQVGNVPPRGELTVPSNSCGLVRPTRINSSKRLLAPKKFSGDRSKPLARRHLWRLSGVSQSSSRSRSAAELRRYSTALRDSCNPEVAQPHQRSHGTAHQAAASTDPTAAAICTCQLTQLSDNSDDATGRANRQRKRQHRHRHPAQQSFNGSRSTDRSSRDNRRRSDPNSLNDRQP